MGEQNESYPDAHGWPAIDESADTTGVAAVLCDACANGRHRPERGGHHVVELGGICVGCPCRVVIEPDPLGDELAAAPARELPAYPGLDPRWEGHTHSWPEQPDDLAGLVECGECGLSLSASLVYAPADESEASGDDG